MTTPSEPNDEPREPIPGVDFDPYRFGAPEHPLAPEWAPPGYQQPSPSQFPPPPPPAGPHGQAPYDQPQYPQYPQYPSGQYPPGQYPPQWGPPPGYPPPPGTPPWAGGPPYPMPGSGPGGKAITALVLGLCAVVFFWIPFLGVAPGVVGLIFGLIAISESSAKPGRPGRTMALVGTIAAAVGIVAAVIFTAYFVHRVDDCPPPDYSSTSFFCD